MNFKNIARAAIASALLTVTAFASAAPVPTVFTVTKTEFILGSGYGTANDDLDVAFSLATKPGTFDLLEGEFEKFLFGAVQLKELCINAAQSGCSTAGLEGGNETNALGVTAYIKFSSPDGAESSNVALTGAVKGPVAGDGEDFSINFSTVYVDFGSGGQFSVDLNDLSFSSVNESHELSATVTLIKAAQTFQPAPTDLPEPGSLALFGLALAGFAVARRRAAK